MITPEGRQITPKDGTWWSLLVRRAAGFDACYNEAATLRKLLTQIKSTAADTASASGAAAALAGSDAVGLVPYKTSRQTTVEVQSERNHNDVTMTSWPILYDFPTPSTPLHVPKPITSESASTPLSALPWMPTCEFRQNLLRPEQAQASPKWGIGKIPKYPQVTQSISAKPNAGNLPDSSALPESGSAGGAL